MRDFAWHGRVSAEHEEVEIQGNPETWGVEAALCEARAACSVRCVRTARPADKAARCLAIAINRPTILVAMRSPTSSVLPLFTLLAATLLPCASFGQSSGSSKSPGSKSEAKIPDAAARPAETATPKPAIAVLSTDPAIAAAQSAKRAGGGPETPELHFRPPPPPVHTPEEELKTFKIVPGFKIELVASEPMIEAPIAISWDAQGRMYVLEMRDYMHDADGTGEDQPTGRVSRLEDTNGDGVMDKATVFADNLLMPRAVMALGDGAIINEPPNLVWYRDTDGDGVADKKEIISDKYANKGGQPEHMANSPTWMMDNWISSTGYGTRFRFQQGKFTAAETVGSGQWGRTQDDWGREFSNSNSDLLRTDLVPPSYYLRNPRLADRSGLGFQVMKDQTTWPGGPTPGVNRGYIEDSKKPDGTPVKGTLRPDGSLQSVTATCGPAIYRGDLFPKEYRGNAFIPEPSGNLVKRLILTEKDGVVTAKNAYEGKEFLTSTDERFRPVNAYTGPDGALYIVDMARGVLQHKGFLTYYLVANIKDRKLEQPVNLGRIFRIVPTGGKKPAVVKLPQESEKIVPLLDHANGAVRDIAQRVLVERGDAVGPEVERIASKSTKPEARVQALWTLQGLNALTPEVLTAALHDPHEKVRAAAVRLADPSFTPELLKLVDDASAEVRLHAVFKLSGQPGPEVEEALIALLEKGGNPYFSEAVASGLGGRELEFLEMLLTNPAVADQKLGESNIFAVLAGCVMKERSGQRIARLLELASAQPTDSTRQVAMLTAMAGKGSGKPSKNPPPSRPIKLGAQPASLTTLLSKQKAKIQPLVARIDQQLIWPGKPGVVEVPVVPLTAEQQALFEKGKTIYATICGACHQPSGAGMPGLAPPLLDSNWVLGAPDRIIRIVTQGLTGPIDVSGTKWQLEMPGLPIFSDEDVAGILTYIRREWEHNASPVTPGFVTNVRAAIKSRTKPWTAEELNKPVDVKTVSAK
jgi:glucose/arabinose dehydrogenase/mono/diheme cytochrome c family protein